MYRVLRVSDQNLISERCGEYVYLSYQILITFRYTLVHTYAAHGQAFFAAAQAKSRLSGSYEILISITVLS
jgi:hypothetical protein